MTKHIVKITQKELEENVRNTIAESLEELTQHQKQRNVKNVESFFKKSRSGYNGIRTIVVLTSENPNSQQATNQFNKKTRHSLLSDIKNGGYVYVPAIGKFGNTEHPYAVFNMSIDTAKMLCGKYQQTSFIFSQLLENGTIHSEYYEKEDATAPYDKQRNTYVKKDESDIWEDMSEANDYFAVIGKNFKYTIPFKIFNTVNETICKNLHRIISIENKHRNNTLTEEKVLNHIINGVGYSPYLWRKSVTEGL